jgi:hypothetical protein
MSAAAADLSHALGSLELEMRTSMPCDAVGFVIPSARGTLRFEGRNRLMASAVRVRPEDMPDVLRLPIADPQREPCIGSLRPGAPPERFFNTFGLKSIGVAPLDVEGGGGLYIARREPSSISDADLQRLDEFARRLVAAARADELVEELERRLARLDALADLLPVLGTALDVRGIFDHVATIARRVLPHDFAVVGLHFDDGRRIRIHALSTLPGLRATGASSATRRSGGRC